MPSWTSIAALCGVLAVLGAATDRMLLRSSKRWLYDYMTNVWYRLHGIRVGDLPARAAGWLIDAIQRAHERHPIASWIYGLGFSVALTVGAAICGRILRTIVFPGYDRALPDAAPAVTVVATHVRWLLDKLHLYAPELLVNYAFDAATIVITLYVLAAVRRQSSVPLRLALLLANVAIAFALSVACLVVSYRVLGDPRSWGELTALAYDLMRATLTMQVEARHASNFDEALYGASTLIPIGLFALLLVVLVVAKATFVAARTAMLYWLELLTEPTPKEIETKFAPFTLCGLLFGSLGAIAKLLGDLALRGL